MNNEISTNVVKLKEVKTKKENKLSEQELWVFNYCDYPTSAERVSGTQLRKKGLMFTFGKYAKYSVDEVFYEDPGYLIWCWENIKTKLPKGIKDFIKTFPNDIKEMKELDDRTNKLF